MKIGIIEWENNGKLTGTYTPYIITDTDVKNIMFTKDGKPLYFYSRKQTKEYTQKWISEREIEP